MTLLLAVENLEVTYPGSRRSGPPLVAVRDVTLGIERGESVGVVGESGSGKSTVARAVLGLVRPSGGRIVLDGSDVTSVAAERRGPVSSQIQAVFQDPYTSFNPLRTVGQSLVEPLRNLERVSASQAEDRATEILVQVGLSRDVLGRFPGEFSGGQLQRLAIARALVLGPRLVVCDEPVSSLDVSTQAQVLKLLEELRRRSGVAYLFIGHDLGVVRLIAERIVVLYQGRVMEAGASEEVTSCPRHPYTQALVAAAPVTDVRQQRLRREARRTLIGSARTPPSLGGCPFAPRCPYSARVCTDRTPAEMSVQGVAVSCHRYDPHSGHPVPVIEGVRRPS